jgi:hypothetical protein
MTQKQLLDVMITQLTNFTNMEVPVTENTLHYEVLVDIGTGVAQSRNVYQAHIKYCFKRDQHPEKPWPAHWLQLSVRALAEQII